VASPAAAGSTSEEPVAASVAVFVAESSTGTLVFFEEPEYA